MRLITKLCLLLGYLIQINNADYQVHLTAKDPDVNSLEYTCTSSGSDGFENVQGFWKILCTGNKTETILATFGGYSGGFQRKHPYVLSGSSTTTMDIHLPSRSANRDSESSEEDEEEEDEDDTTSKSGPSSTLKMKPLCDGLISCKLGYNSTDVTGRSSALPVLGPLITTHTRNRTRTGQTLGVQMSCRPQRMCGTYNVTWYHSSNTITTIGRATYWNESYSDGCNTTWGSEKLKWDHDGSVQVNRSLWTDEFEYAYCVSCKVETCGAAVWSMVCDSGYTAYYSSGHRIQPSSWQQMLLVFLGVFLITR
ncbi:putative membrane glycoprotein [Murid betaherpesvirus 1]|uniref:Membrane glycoprotein n=3 Tax=Muromegalovirus muridbeta1 TaxID=3050323 RepID=D3XDY2_MUHVS|nr:putative membrane glycoprotein [Murid betaherpesvirus 1]YP_214160.1 Putative membrane glycoprotein [Murid betaherpesvirus 1]CAP08199.1 m160 protein [Murine cytomegalovirus (strain K181)]ADD10526.1 putative membrane glycoprotein [Murid betaherpesvirus 1]AQQ81446.1 m160 protein [Murid betaherpesvirus 1]WEG71801.1 membrane protein m160 [Murid betaherpesvirus 1]CAJ1013378.1 m160 protein [Murid betaherpesvirus 1]